MVDKIEGFSWITTLIYNALSPEVINMSALTKINASLDSRPRSENSRILKDLGIEFKAVFSVTSLP